MNLIFMRHGEATDNVREIISDKEIYWSTLTDEGKKVVLETLENLNLSIDKIYVSPLPRTIQTASLVCEKFKNVDVSIDNRIREIGNGKYSGKQNNPELDNVRERQVAGDFFVRFGEYGENKYDIESRLSDFLKDVYEQNFKNNTIMIVSHGSITSFMKRILCIKSAHIKTGKAEIFEDVDFSKLYKHIDKLKKIKKENIAKKISEIQKTNISETLKKSIIKLCKTEFNNIEFSDDVFTNFINGLNSTNLKVNYQTRFDDGIIAVCFYNNASNFLEQWFNHYISIGVKNFVMVDNCSSDGSSLLVKKFCKKVNIDCWSIDEKYNCFKMCGWKQQILEHYGTNKRYIFVDSDELFIYENFKNVNINEYIKNRKNDYFKSILLDVYSKNGIEDLDLNNYNFVDGKGYKMLPNANFGCRVYGGCRNRIFGIRPSLQKVPIITYHGKEIYINDHFYYPWEIDRNASTGSFLLHYKFLKGDIEKYKVYAEDERHWNNSREYKVYIERLNENKNLNFYDENFSIKLEDIFKTIKF